MSKKFLAFLLTALLLFASLCVPVSAEGEEVAPAMSFTKTVNVLIDAENVLTDGALAPFNVDVELIDKNIVAFDGATPEHSLEILSITSQRDGQPLVTYDPENPDEFLDIFRFPEGEERKALPLNVTFKVDFAYAEVFGDLGYQITVTGFSAPPDLGISIGDMVAVPTDIVHEGEIEEFPSLQSISVANASTKMIYTDAEYPELNGVAVNVVTSTGANGVVTYANSNAHMFTTFPAKNEKLTIDANQIVTYFYGIKLTTLPITVDHDWSKYPVSITTDKYTETKPGYHAIVCNGCGEAHTAEPHVADPSLWVSNNDQTFTANGTSSQPCQICGATLTKDDFGSADYNDAFANYHFLKVIFDYINLILRIISGAGIN